MGKMKKRESSFKIRRSIVRGCWLIAGASFLFAVYKNFTAVDKVTVKEQETVVEKVENYSGIETFTENFAKVYFAYPTGSAEQIERKEMLKEYMQQSLVGVNNTNLYAGDDITVEDVQIWGVEDVPSEENTYCVYYTVKMKGSGQAETNAYTMDVYCDSQQYVVVKNPRITSMPQTSKYERQGIQASDRIVPEDREAVETFLETFFDVYPSAVEKELNYYVKDPDVKPIGKEYTLVSIDGVEIKMVDNGYEVGCYVTYMDHVLDAAQIHAYEMSLAYQEDGELIMTSMR